MSLDDGARHGEPETGTGHRVIEAHTGLEDATPLGSGDPRPTIRDDDGHGRPTRGSSHPNSGAVGMRQRVREEVVERLSQTRRVRLDEACVAVDRGLDGEAAQPGGSDGIIHESRDVDTLAANRRDRAVSDETLDPPTGCEDEPDEVRSRLPAPLRPSRPSRRSPTGRPPGPNLVHEDLEPFHIERISHALAPPSVRAPTWPPPRRRDPTRPHDA